MKTQVVHSFPSLGPFVKLILTLTLRREAETGNDLQNPAGEGPDLSATAAGEQQREVKRARHVFTRAFLMLLLRSQSRGTLHYASSLTGCDRWQGLTVPRGAVLAARYASH
jgi:hypothetical protein